jgi:hypothetical protein
MSTRRFVYRWSGPGGYLMFYVLSANDPRLNSQDRTILEVLTPCEFHFVLGNPTHSLHQREGLMYLGSP